MSTIEPGLALESMPQQGLKPILTTMRACNEEGVRTVVTAGGGQALVADEPVSRGARAAPRLRSSPSPGVGVRNPSAQVMRPSGTHRSTRPTRRTRWVSVSTKAVCLSPRRMGNAWCGRWLLRRA